MGVAVPWLVPSCQKCENWSRLLAVPLGTWLIPACVGLGMESLELDLALAGWAEVAWGLLQLLSPSSQTSPCSAQQTGDGTLLLDLSHTHSPSLLLRLLQGDRRPYQP